jgi:peroxiredoxin
MRLFLALTALLVTAAVGHADRQAPNFTLPDMDGADVALSSYLSGGPVLLTFWSTWCANCPQELRQFQLLYDEYKSKGFVVVSIAVDGTKTVSKVRPFVVGKRFTFPVLMDTNNDVMRLYQIIGVPTSFLLDASGTIRHTHVGYHDGDELTIEEEIISLMEE